MRIKIFLIIIISLLGFPIMNAQDTAHAAKQNVHQNTTHKPQTPKKDTLTHIPKPSIPPKYKRTGYAALMYGYGSTTGSFATNAFASRGSVASISVAFPGIISHGGIAFKFDYGRNALDTTQFLNNIYNSFNLPYTTYTFPGMVVNYSYKTALTGLYLTYPSKHFTIDVRVLGGVMVATIPAETVYISKPVYGGDIRGTFNEYESESTAFAIDFGMEVRYLLRPRLSIIASVDYLHAAPSFTVVTAGTIASSNGNLVNGNNETVSSQPFDLYNLSLGIGYTISAQKQAIPR